MQMQRVHVVARVRPAMHPGQCLVRVDAGSPGQVLVDGPHPRCFSLDTVLGPECDQAEVYRLVGQPVVDSVMHGFNGTVLAYGQTGSGKTYTMQGVMHGAFSHIFDTIAEEQEGTVFDVHASYLEVYNEKVYDLLGVDSGAPLQVLEHPERGMLIRNLSAYVVRSADDLLLVVAAGSKRRAVASTLMNDNSSRSHTVMQVTVQRRERHVTRTGVLNMVDLAGSERQSRSGAVGQQFLESCKINQSLATLGKVVTALLSGASHVPYRESKLTLLLKDSLGGSAVTTMVGHVSPLAADVDETLCTLWYVDRARHVRNHVRVNESPRDVTIERYLGEIMLLRRELQQLGEDEPIIEQDTATASREESEEEEEEEEEMSRWEAETEEQRRQIQETLHEQEDLRQKLKRLEMNFMVNGENLLEKCARQDRLLQEYEREMEATSRAQRDMESQLRLLEAQLTDLEGHCDVLEEDADTKVRNINKVVSTLGHLKAKLRDLEQRKRKEVSRKRCQLEQMVKLVKWCDLLIQSFVPACYMDLIDGNMVWGEETAQWTVKYGNHCSKHKVARCSKSVQPCTDCRFASYSPGAGGKRVAALRLPRLRDQSRLL